MRIISNYPDYSIDEDGNIFNTKKGFKLKKSIGSHGYYVVSLNRKTHLVHRLVAGAFCQGGGDGLVVNHIDEDRLNNHCNNLEWCTQAANVEHSTAKKYTFRNPSGELVNVFNLGKFSLANGLNAGHMSSVSTGARKSHKGWRSI